jgi:hypothetical protein
LQSVHSVFFCFVLLCSAHANGIKVVDRQGAYRLGRASLWVSVSGMIIGIIAVAIIVAMAVDQHARYVH